MTTYGNSARTVVDTSGGGIAGLTVGTSQKLVVFGRGDTNSGSASTETPTEVSGPSDAEEKFGSNTRLTDTIQEAANNGVEYSFIYGVMPKTTSVSSEDITGGADAIDDSEGSTVGNLPLIEDAGEITIVDDDDNEMDVEFHFVAGSDLHNLSPSEDEFYLNKFTGEWVADEADNYSISYKYLEWQNAFDSATDVVREQETGLWRVVSESEDIINAAQSEVEPLREKQWKMVRVNGGAQPNNDSNDATPVGILDGSSYDDSIDDDYVFLTGPERLDGSKRTVAGGVAGVFAGHDLTNPILGDTLTGYEELAQELTVPEQLILEDEQVIPLADTGEIALEANISTSEETDWRRTYEARRIVDQVILIARAVARDTARGSYLDEDLETRAEEDIKDEIINLVDMGVLRANTNEETRWSVSASQDTNDNTELDISLGVTPTPVTSRVDVDLTVNT